MNDALRNQVRAEVLRYLRQIANIRTGIVTGYDPNRYMATVNILPEADFPLGEGQGPITAGSPLGGGNGPITGWLPIATHWSGNGWGDFSPPSLGDQVIVVPREDGAGTGIIVGRIFDARSTPHLPVPTINGSPFPVQSGEKLTVHQSGSYAFFSNDGSVTFSAATDLTLEAPNGTARLAGQTVQMHATQELRYDVNGYGYVMKYSSGEWFTDSWVTGASAGTTYAITPPEIPE